MAHILITGGTGMLSGAVTKFLSEYKSVSVIARHESGFQYILSETNFPERLNPILLDYSCTDIVSEKIISSIQNFGYIEKAVSWIHSHAERAHEVICNLLSSQNISSDYFQILGSAYSNPERSISDSEKIFTPYENISYKKILLGFKIENGISRWLTEEEISDGVYKAVNSGEYEFKIGLTKPWEKRP